MFQPAISLVTRVPTTGRLWSTPGAVRETCQLPAANQCRPRITAEHSLAALPLGRHGHTAIYHLLQTGTGF